MVSVPCAFMLLKLQTQFPMYIANNAIHILYRHLIITETGFITIFQPANKKYTWSDFPTRHAYNFLMKHSLLLVV